jgi:repressor LexA
MMEKTMWKKIRLLMIENDIDTQKELASRCEFSESILVNIRRGKTNQTRKVLESLANNLNTTIDYLISENEKKKPDFRDTIDDLKEEVVFIHVLGYVPAGYPTEEEIFDSEEVIPVPASAIKSDKVYFALKVKGDSMSGKAEEGDIVLICPDEEIENGGIGVVTIDGEACLKRVYFDEKNKKVFLHSLNSAYGVEEVSTAQKDFRIVGRFIGRWQWA